MNDATSVPFSDFSSRFRTDLRRRPIHYIVSGPSLAKSGYAIGKYIDLNPMIGTHNLIGGAMDILRPLYRRLDIWMNITAQQDIEDWRIFLELLATPETGIILTPFAWMAYSHLMELEREFVIRHFHKVIPYDLESHPIPETSLTMRSERAEHDLSTNKNNNIGEIQIEFHVRGTSV
jgi:hypothetical protein